MEIGISLFFVLVMIFVFAIPILFAGGIIFLLMRANKKGQQRTAAFQALAREAGLQYIGKTPFSSLRGAEHFYLFSLGNNGKSLADVFTIKIGTPEYKRIENLIYGASGGFQISIFDYVYTAGHGRNYKGHYQTVVMLESERLNLPLFSLRPEGAWQEIGQLFSGQDIDFPTHPIFSGKYLLRGASEPHIRQTFNNGVLSYFEPTEGMSVEGGGNRIYIYRHKVSAAPEQLRWVFDEAIRVGNLFLNP